MSRYHPIRIGTLELPNNLLCAPVAGISNAPFRLLARRYGCGLVVTELIKARPLVMGIAKTMSLVQYHDDEHPIACQIGGSETEWMVPAAQKIEALGFDVVDLNMGCPVKKITRQHEGCALMQRPADVARIVEAVASAVKIPVTVKIRSGWNRESINAPEIARIAEDNGAAMVTVHGRTRAQLFSGSADWDIIGQVKEAVKRIPVIGNGDVKRPEDAEEMMRVSGCDGVMIARGAFGKPWIFRDVAEYLTSGTYPPPEGIAKKKELVLWHYTKLLPLFGDVRSLLMMRKYACWYTAGLPNATVARDAFQRLESEERFLEIVEEFFIPNPAFAGF